jgi:hypothetical protein
MIYMTIAVQNHAGMRSLASFLHEQAPSAYRFGRLDHGPIHSEVGESEKLVASFVSIGLETF